MSLVKTTERNLSPRLKKVSDGSVFPSICERAFEYTIREHGLPGRPDLHARNDERAADLEQLCRRHHVRFAEQLPKQALIEHRQKWMVF